MILHESLHHSEYSEAVYIHKDEIDPTWPEKYTASATIGMRRKGIAIAYVPERYVNHVKYCGTYYLINKDNKVIFELNTAYEESYFRYLRNRIYRTIKGFYILEYNGFRIQYRVGKDNQEFEYTKVEVLDENGDKVSNWDENDIKIEKECHYMDYGIFECENTFYDSESLEELFSIPSTFHVDTIFERNLAHLSSNQCYEFAVIVKDKNIIEHCPLKDSDSIKDKYEKAEKLFLSKMHLSHQKQQRVEDSNNYIDKYGYVRYSSSNVSKAYYEEVFISERNYIESYGDFENINYIDNRDVKILNTISINLQTYQNNQKRRMVFRLDKNIDIFIYSDVYILAAYDAHNRGKIYNFYNTNGQKISSNTYRVLTQMRGLPNNLSRDDYDMESFEYITETNNMIFWAKDISNKQYIVRFEKGMLIETALPRDPNGSYSLQRGYIYYYKKPYTIKFFDFDMNPIEIKYINCHIMTEINNYLYSLKEKFRSCWGGYFQGKKAGEFIAYPRIPIPTLINGILALPFPKSFESCIAMIDVLNENRKNDVSSIEKIRTYITEQGIFHLYKFVCKPHGYCDRFGNLYYDFNPNTVKF